MEVLNIKSKVLKLNQFILQGYNYIEKVPMILSYVSQVNHTPIAMFTGPIPLRDGRVPILVFYVSKQGCDVLTFVRTVCLSINALAMILTTYLPFSSHTPV